MKATLKPRAVEAMFFELPEDGSFWPEGFERFVRPDSDWKCGGCNHGPERHATYVGPGNQAIRVCSGYWIVLDPLNGANGIYSPEEFAETFDDPADAPVPPTPYFLLTVSVTDGTTRKPKGTAMILHRGPILTWLKESIAQRRRGGEIRQLLSAVTISKEHYDSILGTASVGGWRDEPLLDFTRNEVERPGGKKGA